MLRIAHRMGVVALGAAALVSCRDVQGTNAAAEDTSYRLRPGYVVDSVRPIEVELENFRKGLGPAPTELNGGGSSLNDLVSRFAAAVEARDTSVLRAMQISAAEFAWLIYPSSPYTKPPYQETPQMIWRQLRTSGETGLRRLIERRGGERLHISRTDCDNAAIEAENRLYRHCAVRTVMGSDTTTERLFGVIVERGGHFKFANYANQY